MDYRSDDGDHVFSEISMIIADLVLAAAAFHRIEIHNPVWSRGIILIGFREKHGPFPVNEPDGRFKLYLDSR